MNETLTRLNTCSGADMPLLLRSYLNLIRLSAYWYNKSMNELFDRIPWEKLYWIGFAIALLLVVLWNEVPQ